MLGEPCKSSFSISLDATQQPAPLCPRSNEQQIKATLIWIELQPELAPAISFQDQNNL